MSPNSAGKNLIQKSKLLFIVVVWGLYFATLQGQETVSTIGGNVTGTGGSISYTFGQTTFNLISGTSGLVIQGVQHAYEISIVTDIQSIEEITLDCIVYPNPSKGTLRLVIKSYSDNNMMFRLYDLNGVLLQDKIIEGRETEISMVNLSSAVYFLKILEGNKEIKTFKIVKI